MPIYDLTETIAWCIAGTTAEEPRKLRSLLSCIDYRERIVATHEELCHNLRQLRADGRVAGNGGRYFSPPPGKELPPFEEPSVEDFAAGVRAYTAQDQR